MTVPTITREESLTYWREQLAGAQQDLESAMENRWLVFTEWKKANDMAEECWKAWVEMKAKVETLEGIQEALNAQR